MRVLFLVVLAGCGGGDVPCMHMGPPGPLAQSASELRLDVYEGDAHCAGARLQPGGPPPISSRAASGGQPLVLDVPEGPHVLVLTALDAGGAIIGSACTETDLGAGMTVCFDLTLEASPDLASPPLLCDGGPCVCTTAPDSCPMGYYCASDSTCAPGCKGAGDCGTQSPLCDLAQHRCVECLGAGDCPPGKRCSPGGACVDGCDVSAGSTCPGTMACCSSLCVDTSDELSSCGACGRACDSTHVAAAACAGSVCTSSCLSGWLNCNKPIAPAVDDGCETSANDVMHCGGCTNVCNLPNATADCPTGSCKVKTCAANHFDCDGAAASGCECAGVDLLDGNKGCCGTGCQVQHGTGLADSAMQQFYDCTAFGTYTVGLAQAAGRAWFAGTVNLRYENTCGTNTMIHCVRKANPGQCACWAYAGDGVGHVKEDANACMCPTTSDLPYK